MVVPLGWMLDDRREAVPRLFKPREVPTPTKVKPKRHRSTGRDETGQLELGVVPDDTDSMPAPEVPMGKRDPAAHWRPVFDQNDDLDGLLTADSPLLARAFGRRERPDRG
jgi:hypothetical protein